MSEKRELRKGDIVNVQAIVSFEYIASPSCLRPPLTTYEDRFTERQAKVDLESLERDGAEVIYRPVDRYNGARSVKAMIRTPISAQGIMLGKRQKATGYFYYGGYEDQSTLAQDKRHWVEVVQPLETEFYTEPWLCLRQDLEAITDA